MKFYHATTEENAFKIFRDREIKKGLDGCIYLCKDALDACKFLAIRGIDTMAVIELELDESEVVESNDHSEQFFQCKAYMYMGNIVVTGKENVEIYETLDAKEA